MFHQHLDRFERHQYDHCFRNCGRFRPFSYRPRQPLGDAFSPSYDTRYTVTVAFGRRGDAIMNGSQLGSGDFTQMVEGTPSGTLLPNGWYNCGSGNPQNMNGFQGWGGFGDISYSLTAPPVS